MQRRPNKGFFIIYLNEDIHYKQKRRSFWVEITLILGYIKEHIDSIHFIKNIIQSSGDFKISRKNFLCKRRIKKGQYIY